MELTDRSAEIFVPTSRIVEPTYADALTVLPPRVAKKIYVCPATGCWTWTGAKDSYGYGNVKHGGKCRRVHRVVWEELVGPIPEGMVLDHRLFGRERSPGPCMIGPSCCRPDHLELTDRTENGKRIRNWNAAKLACPDGHDYARFGKTYDCKDGRTRRFCSECQRLRRIAEKESAMRADEARAFERLGAEPSLTRFLVTDGRDRRECEAIDGGEARVFFAEDHGIEWFPHSHVTATRLGV